jgi:hypothetical protein
MADFVLVDAVLTARNFPINTSLKLLPDRQVSVDGLGGERKAFKE